MRKSCCRFAVLVAAVLAAAVAAQSARAAAPGVVTDLTWAAPALDTAPTIAALQDVGVGWVRLSAQWKNVEQVHGVYDAWWLNELDRSVQAARGAGFRIVFTVYDAPAWASGSSSRNSPKNPADFASFMSFLVRRYAGQVEGWEIWNEENTARFWTSPSASAYAALLKAAYPAVKAADPGTKVIFGGTSTNDYRFIEAVYAAGAKGSFDVMALHPYPYCGNTSPDLVRRESDGRMTRDSFLAYREVRASMLARGDDKPIWVTEYGWNTSTASCDPGAGSWQGGVSETLQASYLTRSYELFAQDPYLELALVYNFRDNYWQGDADTPEARYGLMLTSFVPKPAYFALKAVATGAPAPTPPPPPPPPAPESTVAVTITTPADGSTFSGSLRITAAASGPAPIARVEFRVDGILVKTLSGTSSAYTFKWNDARRLAPGPHRLEARAVDVNGASATAAITVTKI